MDHPVPRRTASWWYTFGSATLALFVLQIATGICLALVYVPSADKAYESLLYLNYEAPFGWFLRAAHFWGSNAMVAVMTLHMIQVFLWGAHKYPREMTWVVGVLLFLCTLGMAFSGQIMRWDQDAYWGLGIGASIAARTPFIGESVVPFILGGPIIAGRTLSRVFTAHVFLIPGILIALVGLHLWLVLRLGVNEWPMPGRLVDRETYRQRYEEEVHKDGVPFFPDAARKDMVSMGLAILLVLFCAAIFGPFGPHGVPDPSIIDTAPKPDFYFLALFALFALLPPWTETVLLVFGPPLAIVLLLAVPFLAGTGEKSWKRRPVAVLGVILIVLTVTTLAGLGVVVPWSPVMGAWSASADAGGVREGADSARAPGGPDHPEQAMPQLSQPRRRRWPAGSRPRRRRHPPDAGSADPSGPAREREHAGVREEPHPGRGDRARGLHADASSRQPAASTARRRARRVGAVRATAVHSPPGDAR